MKPVRPAGDAAGDAMGGVRAATLASLEPATLYRILALRTEVFVVEQQCVYADLDRRDLEPDAHLLWTERAGEVTATLRLLVDPDGAARIGRVATRVDARGAGLAARLMHRALALAAGRDVVLDAQAALQHWYANFGFIRDGADFVEDGIPHVPMRLARRSSSELAPP